MDVVERRDMQRTHVTNRPTKEETTRRCIPWCATTIENQVTQQGGVLKMRYCLDVSKVKVKEGMYCKATVKGMLTAYC